MLEYTSGHWILLENSSKLYVSSFPSDGYYASTYAINFLAFREKKSAGHSLVTRKEHLIASDPSDSHPLSL